MFKWWEKLFGYKEFVQNYHPDRGMTPDLAGIREMLQNYNADYVLKEHDFVVRNRVQFFWGYGAKKTQAVVIPPSVITMVEQIFNPESEDGADNHEREQLRRAIAVVEEHCARVTGTENDRPSISVFYNRDSELDCVDEALNVTMILLWLHYAGFTRHHRVMSPSWKQPGLFRMPHYAGRICDVDTGTIYAVDSGVTKPGGKPKIVDWRLFYV